MYATRSFRAPDVCTTDMAKDKRLEPMDMIFFTVTIENCS